MLARFSLTHEYVLFHHTGLLEYLASVMFNRMRIFLRCMALARCAVGVAGCLQLFFHVLIVLLFRQIFVDLFCWDGYVFYWEGKGMAGHLMRILRT